MAENPVLRVLDIIHYGHLNRVIINIYFTFESMRPPTPVLPLSPSCLFVGPVKITKRE